MTKIASVTRTLAGVGRRLGRGGLFRRVLFVGLLLIAFGLGRSILDTALSDPPTVARAADEETAKREVVPEDGIDFQSSQPADWILSAPGIVEPADRPLQIAGEVPGRVAEIAVEEGQTVTIGDLLVRLDTDSAESEVDALIAERDALRADLEQAQSGSLTYDVVAARAEVTRAESKAALSSSIAARAAKLFESNSIAREEYERDQRTAEVDAAELEVARAELAVAESRRKEAVARFRARLKAAEARITQARAAIRDREIRAPIDGEILQVRVRVGEFADPVDGAAIVMGDTRRLRARVDVDERELAGVKLGQAATIRVSAFPDTDFSGEIVEIGRRMGRKNVRTDDPVERNDTKILEVVIELEPTDRLVVGQRVEAYLHKREGGPTRTS